MRQHLFQPYLETQYNTFSTGTRRFTFLLGHVVFKVASKCTCSGKLQIFVVVKFTMHSIVAVCANYYRDLNDEYLFMSMISRHVVREAEVILLNFSRGKFISLLNCSLDVQ